MLGGLEASDCSGGKEDGTDREAGVDALEELCKAVGMGSFEFQSLFSSCVGHAVYVEKCDIIFEAL